MTDLIDGGVPEGTSMEAGEEGCLTNNRTMSTMTMQGNKRTMPRGIEMEEFLLSRMRRRKKANFGNIPPFSSGPESADGREKGARLASRIIPMGTAVTENPVERKR